MIRVVPTGDLGLDVLLGGGWRLVKRFEDRESATVVVRGGSGAGKTLVAIQVAIELARELGGDVAVGCVEILPTEYIAQLQSARPSLAASQIVRLPSEPTTAPGPRVFVGLLTELHPESPDLVTSLEKLDAAVVAAGGKPRAFVVDSLIEGYGIGSSANRIDVDDVMKFAAHYGYGLVLCEEVGIDGPSPWVFAADTVLQLGVESRERGRWIEVRKHRFGPSATGRHELDVVSERHPEAFPESHAWLTSRFPSILKSRGWGNGPDRGTPRLVWSKAFSPRGDVFDLEGGLVFVEAENSEVARTFAYALRPSSNRTPQHLAIDLDPLIVVRDDGDTFDYSVRYVPITMGAARALRWLIDYFIARFANIPASHPVPIVIGDIGPALMQDGKGWTDAIVSFAAFVVESGRGSAVVVYNGRSSFGGGSQLAAQSDVWIDVHSTSANLDADIVTRWPRRTQTRSWDRAAILPEQIELDDVPRARNRDTRDDT